ncbi:hypothetical protein [Deinococcus marmoris]|uniref:hypothetical protein n=1 Tax=Deinococcus marmoris TaxID=249408 RepID=UPI0009F81B10
MGWRRGLRSKRTGRTTIGRSMSRRRALRRELRHKSGWGGGGFHLAFWLPTPGKRAAMWAGSDVQAWDIAGPACESGDLLVRDMSLPRPRRGELLSTGEAGAYGAAMSGTRPSPSRSRHEQTVVVR